MASRLKKFRHDRKVSQRELSRITGIEQGTLSRIERGEMELLSPHAAKISRALGIPIARLLGITSNITPAQVGLRRIPILPIESIGKLASPTPAAEDVEMNDFVLVNLPYSANTFAFYIADDSMRDEFSEGDLIVIDPQVEVKPGCFVVASSDDGEAFFRKYRDLGKNADGNRMFELLPLNNLYPQMRSDSLHLTIHGVMVEQRKFHHNPSKQKK